MNKFTPAIVLAAIGFSVGFVGTTAVEDFSTTVGDFTEVSEFDKPEYHTASYTTPINESYVDFHNLEANTEYEFGSVVNGSYRQEKVFNTNEKGHADVTYKLSDHKGKGNYNITEEGYKHILRQDGDTVKDFYLTTPVWTFEKQTTDEKTVEFERDEAVVWGGASNPDYGHITLINGTNSDRIESSHLKTNGYIMFDQDKNDIVLLNSNQDEVKRWDSYGYEKAKIRLVEKAFDGSMSYRVVPRTQVANWKDWNTYKFQEPVKYDRMELFTSSDQNTVEYNDGTGWTTSFLELVETDEISFRGMSNGFHLYTYPAGLTDADNDGTVDRNDECPETEGYKANGCPYDEFIGDVGGDGGTGDNSDIIVTPVGDFNSNTTSGIGFGILLGIVMGAVGMYFFS